MGQERPAVRIVLTREREIGIVLGQAGEGEAHMGQSTETPRLSELVDAGRRRANANRWLWTNSMELVPGGRIWRNLK